MIEKNAQQNHGELRDKNKFKTTTTKKCRSKMATYCINKIISCPVLTVNTNVQQDPKNS